MSHHHLKNICPNCSVTETCRCMSPKTETAKLCNKCALNEEAAEGSVDTEAIAATPAILFTGIREITKKRKNVAGIPIIQYKTPKSDFNVRTKGIKETRTSFSQYLIQESGGTPNEDFDEADIISKLTQSAKSSAEHGDEGLAVFGMEGDDGSITKVYIPKEQAKDFEVALAEILHDNPEANKEEIAGILFDLKDRFKIIDVKWPTIQEDEEQAPGKGVPGATDPSAPVPGMDANPAAGLGDEASGLGDDSATGLGDEAGLGGDMPSAGGTEDNATTLAAILDMLRADAEARKADAEAKTADAHAREAESTAKITSIKMQGEEETLDAEAYFKEKKTEKKEADRLKMLARFRQESKPSEMSTPAPAPEVKPTKSNNEEEERVTMTRQSLLALLRRNAL